MFPWEKIQSFWRPRRPPETCAPWSVQPHLWTLAPGSLGFCHTSLCQSLQWTKFLPSSGPPYMLLSLCGRLAPFSIPVPNSTSSSQLPGQVLVLPEEALTFPPSLSLSTLRPDHRSSSSPVSCPLFFLHGLYCSCHCVCGCMFDVCLSLQAGTCI